MSTPRTDEDVRLCRVTSESFGPMVGADFARELERELNEANRLYHLASLLAAAGDELREQMKAECDQLTAEVARWREMARELAQIVKQEYGDWNWRLDGFAALEKGDSARQSVNESEGGE